MPEPDNISTDRAYLNTLFEKEEIMYALSAGMMGEILRLNARNAYLKAGIVFGLLLVVIMLVVGFDVMQAYLDRQQELIDTNEIRIGRLEARINERD